MARGADARDTARVLPLMNMAMADAYFPSACEDGLGLGSRIGQRVAKIYLQPVK